MPNRTESVKERTELFNRIIENAVNNMGERFFVADLFHSPWENDKYYINTLDGLHPDRDGMKMIADVVFEAFKNNI